MKYLYRTDNDLYRLTCRILREQQPCHCLPAFPVHPLLHVANISFFCFMRALRRREPVQHERTSTSQCYEAAFADERSWRSGKLNMVASCIGGLLLRVAHRHQMCPVRDPGFAGQAARTFYVLRAASENRWLCVFW